MSERLLFSVVPVALIGLGVALLWRPVDVILQSRDADDPRGLPSRGEIFRARATGIAFIGLGGYVLYAILTGMPGAEFSPA